MVGGESLEVEAFLHKADGWGSLKPQRPNSQCNITHPQQEQGNVKTYIDNQCWQCGEMEHLKKSCSMLKGKGLFQGRECMNSPTTQRHSPTISKATNIGGKKKARN